jgi:hypothetical protein
MQKKILIYSQEEINQLHDLLLSGKEAVVQDRCIIGYYHLLRARELQRITGEEVVNVHYLMLWPYIAQENDRLVPIHAVTRSIFEKYNYAIPLLDETDFNRHYKAIIQKAGIKGTLHQQDLEPGDIESDGISPDSIGYSARHNFILETDDSFGAEVLRFGYTSAYFKAERQARAARNINVDLFKEIEEKHFRKIIRGWAEKQIG